MNPTKTYIMASALLCICALNFGGCNKKTLEISANPREVNSSGLIDVTWRTKGFETTTLTSNPVISGLPKTVTNNVGPITDKFQVTTTTTFQITGTIQGNNAPFIDTKSVTVTVTPSGPPITPIP
ncbi:MAG: hypothetical protein M3539_04080 [Acidobacteriota bacterium]|nr:hypothetical protein [Acidobacteriota bacterium]